jgi:hypothetical protein
MSVIVHRTASLPDYALPIGAGFNLAIVVDEEYDMDGKTARFRVIPDGATKGFEVSSEDASPLVVIDGQTVDIGVPPTAVSTIGAPRKFLAVQRAGQCGWALDVYEGAHLSFRLQGDIEFLPNNGEISGSFGDFPTVAVSVAPDEAITVTVQLSGSSMGGGDEVTNETVNAAIEDDPEATRAALELGGAALLEVGNGAGTVAAGDDSRLSDDRNPTSHTHGNITNAGAIGSTSGLPIKTGASGVLEAGAFGTGSGQFAEGNDSRITGAVQPNTTPTLSGLNLSNTWNNGGTTFHLDDGSVTDTASAEGSTLLRRQVGGIDKFLVEKSGRVIGTAPFEGSTAIQIGVGALKGGIGGKDNFMALLWANTNVSAAVGPYGISAPVGNSFGLGNSNWTEFPTTYITYGGAEGVIQLGLNHATTPIDYVLKGHNVTTGTGAGITISGGTGSVAKGNVVLDGGNRAAYDASPSATTIRDILIAHGLMAAS